MPDIILVHGAMRSGKTSFCRHLHASLDRAFREGRRERRPCALIEENERDADGVPFFLRFRVLGPGLEGEADSIELGRRSPGARTDFRFREEAFAWAHARLAAAVALGCSPVILDEVGRLEAREGKGLFDALSSILEAARADGTLIPVLSMREEYAVPLLERLGIEDHSGMLRVDASSDPEELAALLASAPGAGRHRASPALHCTLTPGGV